MARKASNLMDYLMTARADRPAPEFRKFLRTLATPPAAAKFPPNPLGLRPETLADIAAWNAECAARKGGSSNANL